MVELTLTCDVIGGLALELNKHELGLVTGCIAESAVDGVRTILGRATSRLTKEPQVLGGWAGNLRSSSEQPRTFLLIITRGDPRIAYTNSLVDKVILLLVGYRCKVPKLSSIAQRCCD